MFINFNKKPVLKLNLSFHDYLFNLGDPEINRNLDLRGGLVCPYLISIPPGGPGPYFESVLRPESESACVGIGSSGFRS